MAKKVKFPLMLPGGKAVRTLEELREHFDLASVLGYYESGRLVEWLSVWYYDEEAEKVKSLDAKSSDFKNRLCDILGVPFPGEIAANINMEDVAEKNKRLEQLKKITADDKILAAVDNVAFTQEELENLLDNGVDVIYLCGEQFVIPSCKDGTSFIGINKPAVTLDEQFNASEINCENVELDTDSLVMLAKKEDFSKSIELWMAAAKAGNAEAQLELGVRYYFGDGVEVDYETSAKWLRKAAEQGESNAQYYMGWAYWSGKGVKKDSAEAVKWFHKAADQGHERAQWYLAEARQFGLIKKDSAGGS